MNARPKLAKASSLFSPFCGNSFAALVETTTLVEVWTNLLAFGLTFSSLTGLGSFSFLTSAFSGVSGPPGTSWPDKVIVSEAGWSTNDFPFSST